MKRRSFIAGLGSAAAWPVMASGQQAPLPVIGWLHGGSRERLGHRLDAFRQGLGELGYAEGQNITIEYRFAENRIERLPTMVADFVRNHVAVIAAIGHGPVAAARAATTAIPIVFGIPGDPVALGFVGSLSRPGGNVTGITSLGDEIGPKRLELLRDLLPTAAHMAALINPTNPAADTLTRGLKTAAGNLGLTLDVLHASSERDIETVFTDPAFSGVIITTDSLFISHADRLAANTIRYGLPAVAAFPEFVTDGGLMAYGGDAADAFRLVGVYTARVLKGERPADLPVQQSTKVELVINLKTAKSLGLTFPLKLLGRADEVIE
jgi:putative tryptophan/tyrosine transport system substrate-binding protein